MSVVVLYHICNYVQYVQVYVHKCIIQFVYCLVIAINVADFQLMELPRVVQPIVHLFSVLLPT